MKRIQEPVFILKLVFVLLVISVKGINAQSVNFELKTSPNIDFTFNTIDKYINGIIVPHALELNVNVTGSQWDLYIGSTTTLAGSWNVVSNYSTTGISPPPSGKRSSTPKSNSNSSISDAYLNEGSVTVHL